jgi:hypothetical protein
MVMGGLMHVHVAPGGVGDVRAGHGFGLADEKKPGGFGDLVPRRGRFAGGVLDEDVRNVISVDDGGSGGLRSKGSGLAAHGRAGPGERSGEPFGLGAGSLSGCERGLGESLKKIRRQERGVATAAGSHSRGNDSGTVGVGCGEPSAD